MKPLINSEIGNLEGVIIHTPGPEVENMTPENAERALYSDILNLSIASSEYSQLAGVLRKLTQVFEVKDLLSDILNKDETKSELLKRVFPHESVRGHVEKLMTNSALELATLLIEGILLERNNLTNYLSREKFFLRPLHNLFFTRDASMVINDKIYVGRMANAVREREVLIMEAVIRHHPLLESPATNHIRLNDKTVFDPDTTFEGGDLQVIRENIFLIGTGIRTSTRGIDYLIEDLRKQKNRKFHLIIQELPSSPESFIHLDMIFTCLNTYECIVYEPVIFRLSPYHTIHIEIENGKVYIEEQPNIPEALKKLGISLKPISVGGVRDPWIQQREQWHSGANFFAVSPGKVIGYERNIHTLEELNKNGYEIIKALDLISGKTDIHKYKKCVITVAGSELSRGGGGARCMTMPVRREEINW